jgi:wyosine [tRNA(Phe)-imidazoG37] synthetase (radical SAM superfamily)
LPFRDDVVYGPIVSRRLGRSLGINLLPENQKVCSFDCVYCQFPRSRQASQWRGEATQLLNGEELIATIEHGLHRRFDAGVRLDSITFCGNGDPSVHPEFAEAATKVLALRDAWFSGAALSVFTNGLSMQDEFFESIRCFDSVFLKLDAGDSETLSAINQPQLRVSLPEHIHRFANVPGLIYQTMVVKGVVDNRASILGDGYADLVRLAQPKAVHLYSIDKNPAYRGIEPVSREELEHIGEILRARLELPVETFFSNLPSGFQDDPRLLQEFSGLKTMGGLDEERSAERT